MHFSNDELRDMAYVIGESNGNCLLAARIYNQRFPQRRQPAVRSLRRVKERFVENSSVCYKKPTRVNYVLDENKETEILLSVLENPQIGQRELSATIGVSRFSLQRVLKRYKYHAYRFIKVQNLTNEDFALRTEYCQWALDKIGIYRNFFNNVLFTDESTFHNNGSPNSRNNHYYADSNPHLTRPRNFQNRWTLNVWGGILGDRVIGPHFFNGTLNGEMYHHFLINDLPILLENVPLNVRQNLWLQQDGAPPHNSSRVRNFLNDQYGGRWIGRGGPIHWSARSPDLTPCDFFLWGYVKDIVYSTPPTTADDMRLRISDAFQQIQHRMLVNVQTSHIQRLQLCLNQNGRNFEHIL
uniref:Transposase n=1 Tax=Anoplophora glabripennis TaxID=217634 RepID=V5G8C7_ANOGL